MKRYLGAHVSAAGGFENGVKNGQRLGINTIQIHPAAPQRWNTKPFEEGKEDKFLALLPESGVEKIFFHGIYLINLANPDDEKFEKSCLSLLHHLQLLSRIKGHGVIFHPGSFKDQPDEDQGFDRMIEGVNWVLERSPDDAMLLLEVAAGSGKIVGAKIDHLVRIYNGAKQKNKLGYALDTQHMWASGYDWHNDLDSIVNEVESKMGLENVHAIHLNDSKTELGSNKDRHANLGEGLIGLEAITNVVNHPKFQDIPFILETPDLGTDNDHKQIEALYKIAHLL